MTVTHYAEVQTELMGIQKKGDLGDFEPGASCGASQTALRI